MARAGGGGRVFRRIIELVLDRKSAKKTERDTKRALDKGTDPKKPTKNLGKIQQGMAALQKVAIRLGGILLAAFSVRAILRFGNQVDESRRTLIRMTGASGDALKALQADTRAIFRTVPESMGEVSTAVGTLNTLLGITGERLRETTRAALDFARANEVEVASAAELIGQLVNRFNLEAEHAEPLMDRLTVAGQRTGASVTDLAKNLLEAGPALSTLGFSLNEQIALIGELSRRGIDANQVTRRLSMTLSRFAQAGARDGTEAWRMLVEGIKNAETELDAVSLATEAFGTRGAALAVDIRQGVLEIDELTGALENADGALAATEEEARTVRDELRQMGNEILARLAPSLQWLAESGLPMFRTAVAHVVRGIEVVVDASTLVFLTFQRTILRGQRNIMRVFRRDTTEIEAQIQSVERHIDAVQEGFLEWGVGAKEARKESKDLSADFESAANAAGEAADAAEQARLEAIKQELARLDLIRQAVDLGVAENHEKVALLAHHREITAELERGNVSLERRIELTERLRAIEESMGLEAPDLANPVTPFQTRDIDTGTVAPMLDLPTEEIDSFRMDLAGALMDPDIQRAATNAAHGISNAFRDAFEAIAMEGEGVAGFMEALFRGTGGAILGMIAEIASQKVAENVANAIEKTAIGLGLSAVGHPGASAAFAAAKQHGVAAAAWAALAGAGGAAQGAVSGGQSGGIPSGAADPAGRQLDQFDRPGDEITIIFHGIDPNSPRHQEVLGQTVEKYSERRGNRITKKYGRRLS